MINNSNDKGTLTVRLKSTEAGLRLCEMGFIMDPEEENFYVEYENGTIFFIIGDDKTIIGSYESTPGPYNAKVLHYPSNRLIGFVGEELICFCKDADRAVGSYIPEKKCLAYYTGSGRITPADNPLATLGLIDGGEIGGAAAFIAFNYTYTNSVFRDYFTMDDSAFKEKYPSYEFI